jgi:hypothetical protein
MNPPRNDPKIKRAKRNPRPQLPGQDPRSHTRRADHITGAVTADLASSTPASSPDLCPNCDGPLGMRTALSMYGKALERFCIPCGRSWHVVGVEVASMFHSTREYRTWNELNGATTVSA